MEILVTGASGFLGKSIVKSLTADNTVFSLSKSAGEYKVALEASVPNFKNKFDLIIHAAGKAHNIPSSALEKNQFYEVNVLGTSNLLKGLENVGVPKQFVFISSVSVYGQESGSNINEDYPLLATDSYGKSKIDAEKMLTQWCNQNNVKLTVLRLPLIAGPNPPGNLAAMIKGIQKGYYFNIDGGKARKSIVLAEDVAHIVLKAAEIGGIFNLTDGIHPSFSELSEVMTKQLGKEKPYSIPVYFAKLLAKVGDMIGSRAFFDSKKLYKITSSLTFDDSKARLELGWCPKAVLKEFKLK
jgi:nucleoside-diphosphate-sugar epimerase